jgi:hypothetical protein
VSITLGTLIALRNRVLDDYVDGRISEDPYRADLHALAVEIDRLLSPERRVSLEERAARVLAEILADSRARHVAVSPARAARTEHWHRNRLERLLRDDPQGYEAELREEEPLAAAEPDEVRMARPILAALADESLARMAQGRVQAIAQRPPPEADQPRPPAFPDVLWTEDDRLFWEELVGGVPCQGCGMAVIGDDTNQRDDEPWPAYRQRIEPVEEEFRSRHPEHGTRWTAGGGPLHCSRRCPPPPLSPEQISRLSQIASRQATAPIKEIPIRHCGTCHQPMEDEHVCQLEDLPMKLRAVVEAVLEHERGRERDHDAPV